MSDGHEGESLHRRLRDLDAVLRTRMAGEHERDLPFEELAFNRWERARRLGFGEGASVYHSVYIYGDVRVGPNSWIGPMVMLDGSGGGIEIGHHCSISAGVHVYTHDTVAWALTGGRAEPARGSVSIGACTHVGAQVVVRHGVTVGEQCVIGAHAFVNADVPDRSIVLAECTRKVVVSRAFAKANRCSACILGW